MLNQYVSMNDGSYVPARSTALVALSHTPGLGAPDPILARHLTRLAAASGMSPPQILPGAAVRLLCVPLPLKSARQRKAALAFAVEESIAAPLEDCQLALGPEVFEGHYLCAVADQNLLTTTLENSDLDGPVVPDYLAVPPPFDPDAWSLWCGEELVYLRFSDGTGLSLIPDTLPNLWRRKGRPELHLWHGSPPAGVTIARQIADTPILDPDIFQIDLRPKGQRRAGGEWRALGRFTLVAGALTALVQIGLLHLDAAALEKIARDRNAALQAQLSQKGASTLNIEQSADVLLAALSGSNEAEQGADPFLSLLAGVASSLPDQFGLEFRELRFDRATRALSVLVNADDLDALQSAETRLLADGLSVTSGTATRTGAGAEMEIIISEAG